MEVLLPRELWEAIGRCLPFVDLENLAATCKRFRLYFAEDLRAATRLFGP